MNWLGTKQKLVYVVGAPRSYLYDGDFLDWIYMPMRWIPVATGRDLIVLPNVWPLREYVSFVEQTLTGPLDVMWINPTHYTLDECIQSNLQTRPIIGRLVQEGALFVPYTALSSLFQGWKSFYPEMQVLGETPVWGDSFNTKAWLHRHANTPDTPCLAEEAELPVLPGYNARTIADLLIAWQLLQQEGITDFIIKPLKSAFGNGMVFLNNMTPAQVKAQLESYSFPWGPVMLEQFVVIDEDDYGERCWSTHYIGPELFGIPTRQVVSAEHTCKGNLTPGFDYSTSDVLQQMTLRAQAVLKPQGIGGFNGCFVRGEPIFLDPNVGRITGVCSSLAFSQMYGPQQAIINQKLGKPTIPLQEAWKRLQQAGLAFDRTQKQGVYIQGWIPSGWSQVISMAQSRKEAELQLYKAVPLLTA